MQRLRYQNPVKYKKRTQTRKQVFLAALMRARNIKYFYSIIKIFKKTPANGINLVLVQIRRRREIFVLPLTTRKVLRFHAKAPDGRVSRYLLCNVFQFFYYYYLFSISFCSLLNFTALYLINTWQCVRSSSRTLWIGQRVLQKGQRQQ